MRITKRILILSLIILMVIFSFGCGSKKKAADQEVEVNKIPVETAEVSQGVFTKTIILSGITQPQASVTVTPKIAGAERIVDLNVEVGDQVTAGQTIAILDQSTIAIQLNSAQIAYDDALRNYERNKLLFDTGAIPKATFEQIETAFKQAKNNLEAQTIAYNNTIVKSPISGVITAVHTEEGTLVSGQTPIVSVANINTLEIETSVNEMQVNKIDENQQVEVMVPAAKEKIFKGKIKSISPVMDDRIKAYPIKITVENKENKIKAGMYAEVELITDLHPDTIVIPAQAVITREDKSWVFVLEGEKAVKKDVVTGLSNDKEVEILQGLKKGEQVLVRGNEDVVDGDQVTVVKRGEK